MWVTWQNWLWVAFYFPNWISWHDIEILYRHYFKYIAIVSRYLRSTYVHCFFLNALINIKCFLSCGADGILLIEVDRVLRPGGYFVWTSPLTNTQGFLRNKENQKRWDIVRNLATDLCWVMLSQQEETVVWKKTSIKKCYASRWVLTLWIVLNNFEVCLR